MNKILIITTNHLSDAIMVVNVNNYIGDSTIDINDIEKTLSYSNLKELWNTIKKRVDKAIK